MSVIVGVGCCTSLLYTFGIDLALSAWELDPDRFLISRACPGGDAATAWKWAGPTGPFKIGLGADRAGLDTRCNQSPAIMHAKPVAGKRLPDQESSRLSDLLRLAHQLLVPSVCVRHRPLAVTTIVTQLVTRRELGIVAADCHRGGG